MVLQPRCVDGTAPHDEIELAGQLIALEGPGVWLGADKLGQLVDQLLEFGLQRLLHGSHAEVQACGRQGHCDRKADPERGPTKPADRLAKVP